MTTPDQLVVAVGEAVKALAARAKLAGVTDPDHFAEEYVQAIRRQGWRPLAPVTALPPRAKVVALPPHDLLEETRAALRAARPQHLEDAEETP